MSPTVVNNMTSRTRGFTLLEILLVVLVLGISAAAFLPPAIESVDAARTRSVLRRLIALHHFARNRAILGAETIVISYHAADNTVRVSGSTPPAEGESLSSSVSMPERWIRRPAQRFEPLQWQVLRSVQLPPDTRILRATGMKQEDRTYYLPYTPSGTTTPYSVEISDGETDRMSLKFNGTSGHVEIHDRF